MSVTFTRSNGTITLHGNTFLYRHSISAVGGKWDSVAKVWELPDTPAALELAQRLEQAPETVPAKRGPGRPPKSPDTFIPSNSQGANTVNTSNPTPVNARDPGNAPDLMAAFAAFVAQHAPKPEAVPVDLEQVRDMISQALTPVYDKLAKVRAERLEIVTPQETRTIEGLQHFKLPDLIRCLSTGLHVWVAGPSQAGKTTAAEQAAKALGLSYTLQGSMTMAHELVGFVDAGGKYHETPFVRTFRNGGLILLDELDRGSNEALLALNAPLANGIMSLPNGETLRAHPDFRCIGAANTWGAGATHEYVGAARIDAAFLQRFSARLAWDYDLTLEAAICGNEAWAKRVQAARETVKRLGIKVMITPRASIAGARLIAAGYTPDQAAEMTYLADMTPAQRAQMGA